MVVTNTDKLTAYATISNQAYNNEQGNLMAPVSGANGQYIEIFRSIDQLQNGFQARAYFNTAENELVVGFAGTEGFKDENLPISSPT